MRTRISRSVAYALDMTAIPETPAWAVGAVEDYLERCRSQRGMSRHTVAAYGRDLAQFFDFCGRAGVDSAVLRPGRGTDVPAAGGAVPASAAATSGAPAAITATPRADANAHADRA